MTMYCERADMLRENKCKQNRGFTLAELLIIVAIIGTIVAFSMPIFFLQVTKAKLATNRANIRAAKVAASADYIEYENGKYVIYVYDIQTGKFLALNEELVGSYTVDQKHTACVVLPNADAVALATKSIYNRVCSKYYNYLFSDDSISKCFIVYVSPDGIRIYPSYNSDNNKIELVVR